MRGPLPPEVEAHQRREGGLYFEHVAKLTKLNREKLGDLTYKELAHALKRRIGFVSAATIWTTAKRDGWVDVVEYTRQWLTDEQILARLKWGAEKLEKARRGKEKAVTLRKSKNREAGISST